MPWACTGIVVPKDRSVGLTPTVAKVASGAAETVPVDPRDQPGACHGGAQGGGRVAARHGCQDAPESLPDIRLDGAVGWVLGAEGQGMRRLTRERCDALVRNPDVRASGKPECLELPLRCACTRRAGSGAQGRGTGPRRREGGRCEEEGRAGGRRCEEEGRPEEVEELGGTASCRQNFRREAERASSFHAPALSPGASFLAHLPDILPNSLSQPSAASPYVAGWAKNYAHPPS